MAQFLEILSIEKSLYIHLKMKKRRKKSSIKPIWRDLIKLLVIWAIVAFSISWGITFLAILIPIIALLSLPIIFVISIFFLVLLYKWAKKYRSL